MGKSDQEMVLKLRGDMDSAIKEIKKLNKEMEGLGKTSKKNAKDIKSQEASYKKIGASAANLTKKLKGLAAAYLSIEGASKLISTTAKLEEGFIEIAKTTGLTGEAMKSMEQSIFDLSTSMAGISVEELQGVAATAGQLGVQGSKDILEFTRVMAMMGTATDLSAEEAAEAMAGLGKSLGVPVSEFERLGSVIDKVSDNSRASARDLVEYTQRIAGMGKTFGLSAHEVIAFSATLKDVGISAELGGTAVQKMMIEILKDTKGFADASGVEFGKYARIVEDEPIKAIELFLLSLSKMSKGAKIQVLDDLKLKSSGAFQTVLKLADGVDLLSKNLNTAGTEWKVNTALMKSYTTASEGMNSQMETLWNQIKELAYKIGVELLPHLKTLAADTGKWISSMDAATIKTFTDSLITLGKTLGTIGSIISTLNDYTMPDFLAGKGAGYLDTVAKAFLSAADGMNNLSDMAENLDDAFDFGDVVEEAKIKVDDFVKSLGSLGSESSKYKGDMEKVKTAYNEQAAVLEKLLAKNLKLQAYFSKAGDSDLMRSALSSLKREQVELMKSSETLGKTYKQVFTDSAEAIDKTGDSAKKLSESTKKYTEAEINDLGKVNQARIKDTEKTLKTLEKKEKKLADDIVKINQDLVTKLAAIEQERFANQKSLADQIKDIGYDSLDDKTAYYQKLKDADTELSNAKRALLDGDLEKYQEYISRYKELSTSGGASAIETNGKGDGI